LNKSTPPFNMVMDRRVADCVSSLPSPSMTSSWNSSAAGAQGINVGSASGHCDQTARTNHKQHNRFINKAHSLYAYYSGEVMQSMVT